RGRVAGRIAAGDRRGPGLQVQIARCRVHVAVRRHLVLRADLAARIPDVVIGRDPRGLGALATGRACEEAELRPDVVDDLDVRVRDAAVGVDVLVEGVVADRDVPP